jgi:asparagine synthase (glutamine-hydrolysing)
VLCHLLEGDPEPAVRRLNGMFGLAAWRAAERELVLARDPFGEKPLYYLRAGATVAFASELRPLQLLTELHGGIDPGAVQEYLLLQYVHAPRTICRHVRKLEPGTIVRARFDDGRLLGWRQRRYYEFAATEGVDTPSLSQESAPESLRRHLIDAVSDRLVADVPVGAFLSGGNDSSLVVAIMARELGVRVQTFSVGFSGSPASEHRAARRIAEHLGTVHHELLVQPAAIEMLPQIVAALDEPNGDSSCLPVYLLSRFARARVTVALSGDGGDELFGGYGRYTDTVREAACLPDRLRWLRHQRRWWTAGRAYIDARVLQMPVKLVRELTGPLDPRVGHLLRDLRARVDAPGQPLLHRLRQLDAATYLPGSVLAKVDRMSMRFALEVRCPFLDVRVADWASRLPARLCHDGRETKKVLRQLALRYLPAEIVSRRKQGFGVPEQAWGQERLLALANDLLLGPGSRLGSFVDRGRLKVHLARQRDPRWFQVYQVWQLLVLEQWLRTCPADLARSSRRPGILTEV